MPRFLLAALAAAALLVPAVADGHSGLRLKGTVTAKDEARSFITVSSTRKAHVLRVPATSFDRIRLEQRVELRGTTLRAQRNGSRVLARRVLFIRSEPLSVADNGNVTAKDDDPNDTTTDDDATDDTTDDTTNDTTDDTTDDPTDDSDDSDDNSGPAVGATTNLES